MSYAQKPTHELIIAHLYFTNEEKDKHNDLVFEKTTGETYILEAKDCKHLTCSKRIEIPKNTKEAAGLHRTLKFKISMLVEICFDNLDILDGLVKRVEARFISVMKTRQEEILWLEFKDVKTS